MSATSAVHPTVAAPAGTAGQAGPHGETGPRVQSGCRAGGGLVIGVGVRILRPPRTEPLTDEERALSGLEPPLMAAPQLPIGLSRQTGIDPPPLPSGPAQACPPDRSPCQDDRVAPATTVAVRTRQTAAMGVGSMSAARVAARRFLAACVEVIGGFRPVAQLRPFCFPPSYHDIADRLVTHPATGLAWCSRPADRSAARAVMPGRATGGSHRTARMSLTSASDRVRLRRVQVCEAVVGVAEVAAVLARRERVWAMALRMEQCRGSWLCTHLEVL